MTRAIEVGLLLPSREVGLWADDDVGGLVDAAVRAEEDGFDSVWVGESPVARPRPDPLTVLAAVAARTRRVRLGTAVLLPLLRHPVALAHTVATLDRLAPHRLILGMAPGAEVEETRGELAALGQPADRRVQRLLDTVTALRRSWGGDDGSMRPRPVDGHGPPLWLAAAGPRTLARAGSDFDGWLPFPPTVARYRDGLRAVRAAAEAAGRDPDDVRAAVYVTVSVDDDPRAAARALDRYARAYYGRPAEAVARMQACHAGTLETATAWIADYLDAGADHVVVRVAEPGRARYSPVAAELSARVRRAVAAAPGPP